MVASFKSGGGGRSAQSRGPDSPRPDWLGRIVGIVGTVASILALFGSKLDYPSPLVVVSAAVGTSLLALASARTWWRKWFQPNQKTARVRFPLFIVESKRSIQIFQHSYSNLAKDIGMTTWAGHLFRWYVPKASFMSIIERKLTLPRGHFEKGIPYEYDSRTTKRRLKRLKDLNLLVWTHSEILRADDSARRDALRAAERQLVGESSDEPKEDK